MSMQAMNRKKWKERISGSIYWDTQHVLEGMVQKLSDKGEKERKQLFV